MVLIPRRLIGMNGSRVILIFAFQFSRPTESSDYAGFAFADGVEIMNFPQLADSTMDRPEGSLPNQPVSELELNRYVGQWHEIAHLPMFFQRKCLDQITATYTLRGNGRLDVRNACRSVDGDQKVSQGIAKPVPGKAGALKVRFAPVWLAWLPWVWGDYWVLEVDSNYRWAVVGSPRRKYLWILSREPSMPTAQFQALIARARQRGYPVELLLMAAPLD